MAWVLFLNDMRASNVENVKPVFRAESKEAIHAFLQREAVAPYKDGQWGKGFRAGGPLEWFNGLDMFGRIVNAGTRDDWARESAEKYDREVGSLLSV